MAETVEEERLFTGYSGRLFLTFSFGWLMIQLGLQLLPPLLPHIIEDLSITSAQAGFALTVYWVMYAVSQYPSGRLSDRLSRKTLLAVGLVALVVGFVVLSGAVTYSLFLVGIVVIGLGSGLYPTPARALISDLFVERRGQALGLHIASGDVGTAAAAGVAIVVVAVGTWRLAFLPIALVLGGVGAMVHVLSRESYVFDSVNLQLRSTGRRLFSNARLLEVFVPYAIYIFTWQSATGFLPTFLHVDRGFSTELASGAFALLFVVGMIVKPLAGVLGDRFGRMVVSTFALVVGSAGLVIMIVAAGTVAVLVGVAVFAAGLMAFSPVMQAYLMDILSDTSMGGDLGAVRTLSIGIGAIGPTYVGVVASVSSYSWAFTGLLVGFVASAILLWINW